MMRSVAKCLSHRQIEGAEETRTAAQAAAASAERTRDTCGFGRCSESRRSFVPTCEQFIEMRRRARAFQGESGSNLIEMALVLPVYFLLVFTLISFAIVLFAYSNATYASKQAVRYAVVHGATSVTPCSATDLQNLVTPYLWGAPTGGVTITPQWAPSNAVGSTVMVTVRLAYSTGMPYGYLNNLVVSTTAEGIILR